MAKKWVRLMGILPLFVILIFIFSSKVNAEYENCKTKIEGTEYYDCGNYIHTYYEKIGSSSIVYSLDTNYSILYVGNIDGTELFYARGFRFYNRSHDDRTSADENLWAVLSSGGTTIYDGSFNDTWWIDDGHEGYYRFSLTERVYAIRQYTSKKGLYRTMAIYNVNDSEIEINSNSYDDNELVDGVNEVLYLKDQLVFEVNGNYGVKNAKIKINGTTIEKPVENNKLILTPSDINDKLVKGEVVNMSITFFDYLGGSIEKQYQLFLVNNQASIKLSTMSSVIESNSRRVLINAIAGKGKHIDTDYCLYYWSNSPDDSLVYDEFLVNYVNSDYKGSYSDAKGVILRNTRGTYYLYALARDDDSYIVVRSEGYNLNDTNYRVNYDMQDAIMIVTLLILAVIPISLYLFIRSKEH